MFLVHKKGFVPGSKMVGGLLPYDFFCEDDPSINLFVFTGCEDSEQKGEQTLWAFSRLERFEAMLHSFNPAQAGAGWYRRVSVLTGPSHNGTRALRFQEVARVLRYDGTGEGKRGKPEYEIHTREGDSYFTGASVSTAVGTPTVIYQH
ncbi:hypothetical protein [Pseudomonas japonica]|uniref:hypothetical protein n=1 Tax=Pseudomonas japonica TaxID=256466 RepID=UPI0015E4892D|nr:hypothetical protein [Pseudomonas japonica]MBA1245912.1 hypothetical protein [Pseudomonas japonica]MBA1289552.1 hypothetical protein [Pseudomonas japonica]